MSERPIKLFISHPSEDKQPFVEQLYHALKATSQFDEFFSMSLQTHSLLSFEELQRMPGRLKQ